MLESARAGTKAGLRVATWVAAAAGVVLAAEVRPEEETVVEVPRSKLPIPRVQATDADRQADSWARKASKKSPNSKQGGKHNCKPLVVTL